MRSNQILFTYLHLAASKACTDALIKSKITSIAYETVEVDGSLPLLLPMSEVAGRMATQVGADALLKPKGGRGVLLAGVPGVSPGKVVVIGGGIAGLNAAVIALGLGADVTVLDRSAKRLAQIDQIYSGRIKTLMSSTASIQKSIYSADLVIGAVLIPGARAPQLVTNHDVSLMKAGDKGTFLLPSSLAFGGNTFGSVPAYSVIKAEVEVVSIKNQAAQIASMQTLYGFTASEKTTSGLIFQKTVENPTGAAVVSGQSVKVNYTGRLGYGYIQTDANGKVIYDSKFGSGTLVFTAGAGQLIPGFEETVLKMKVGEKAKAILPYTIAYGVAGNSSIPGYSPLYFEIEVVSAQ
jgi:FKBP-type peptidyl-prolyl cis-trans isomerase